MATVCETSKTDSGIVSAVGNTPLVELKSLSKITGRRIWGKCENVKSGGSVKDRPALHGGGS